MPFLAAQDIVVVAVAEQRAVIEQLAVLVAPGRVVDVTDLELRRIADREPVEIVGRIAAGDAVLLHRREVIDRRLIADRAMLHRHVVEGERRRVAGPGAPAVELVQRRSPRMERRGQQRRLEMEPRIGHGRASLDRMRSAAFQPAAPEMPPPGCEPAPAR